MFASKNITAAVIGTVMQERTYTLEYQGKRDMLFDLNKELYLISQNTNRFIEENIHTTEKIGSLSRLVFKNRDVVWGAVG